MTFEMKHIFKSITTGIALLACAVTALAQGYDPANPTDSGVNVLKDVVGPVDEDNNYKLTLETFAEGTTAVTSESIPSDIILVLDTSSSMRDYNYGNVRRIVALKTAVRNFLGIVYDNAIECKAKDPNYVNRIAIVTYNRNATMVRSWVDITTVMSKSDDGTYSGALLTQVGTNNNNGFTCASGTRPDHGLDMVINELLDGSNQTAREDANLTVLLFTDGYPTDNNATQLGEPNNGDAAKFEPPIANKTLYYASQIKKDYGAKMYTVGLITEVTKADSWQWRNYCRVLTWMDWLSSNYPDAAWSADAVNANTTIPIESAGSTVNGETRYYSGYNSTSTVLTGNNVPLPWRNLWTFDASNDSASVDGFVPGQKATGEDVPKDGYSLIVGDNDFDSIFATIAGASGGSASDIGADTQIRDVVSNSFILPDDFDEESVTIYTMDIKSDASGWENQQTATGVSAVVTEITMSDGEKRKQLTVEGFDFSKDDEYDSDHFTVTPGNWVGKRYSDASTYYYAGKKLVIEFLIKPNGEATGGDGTNTNHPDSGVYVVVKDDDGNPILDANGNKQYKKVTSYPVPHTELPIIIKITKDGLLHGESATFEVHRTRPKGWNESGTTLEEKMANVEYNALGKPVPDLEWKESATDKVTGWHNWSKVILTNKGDDFAAVTKVLYALDPSFVYEVTEDDWGWSYTLSGTGSTQNTSEVEVNPFTFHNELKPNTVKHAEAVTINHFEGTETESREEHYKSVGKAQ